MLYAIVDLLYGILDRLVRKFLAEEERNEEEQGNESIPNFYRRLLRRCW
jgi:hypothetical protein